MEEELDEGERTPSVQLLQFLTSLVHDKSTQLLLSAVFLSFWPPSICNPCSDATMRFTHLFVDLQISLRVISPNTYSQSVNAG